MHPNRFKYYLIAMYYICALVTRSYEIGVPTVSQVMTTNMTDIRTYTNYIYTYICFSSL